MPSTPEQPIRITLDGQRTGPTSARDVLGASETGDRRRDPVRSMYFHVPFCFHKCHYCDFYSFVDTKDRQGAFVDALILELEAIADSDRRAGHTPTLDTLFGGGGTPTLLALDQWERLGAALHERFAIDDSTEWTVECHPETATPELMALLAGVGVNRLSVGAQTFPPDPLKTLERWHEPGNVEKALDLARASGIERVSLDLIYAIPGQTLGEWEADLARAIAIGPGHVSAYALTNEPNTAMTVRMHRGDFDPADEDIETRMFERTREVLGDAGLHAYEVSNFAADGPHGGPCAHNLAYWRQDQWHGAGPSASAHVAGHRWKNTPRLTDWMEHVRAHAGASPIVDHEGADPKRALAEKIMTGLRLSEGLDALAIQERAAHIGCTEALRTRITRAHDAGHLETKTGRWVLTSEGLLLADLVSARLMEALD